MTQTLDDLRLLRPREAADLLGVSVRQIDRMVDAGTLRPVRLLPGGNRRFRADLAALITDTKEDDDG
jgi:excisionase family DNA binding protein